MIASGAKKLLLALCLASASAMAQQTAPTEAQCRQMVSSMIQAVKSPKLETERDKKDASALIERIEKILRDNRARDASECASWAEMAKMATRQ